MNAQRDENRVTVAMGISTADLATTLPLRVDPATDRLLVSFTPYIGPAVLATNAGRDGDRRPTIYGVTDDANKTLVPLLIDHLTGALLVDFG